MGLLIAVIVLPIPFMLFGVYVVKKLTIAMLRLVFLPLTLLRG